jgi:hypothetical protein
MAYSIPGDDYHRSIVLVDRLLAALLVFDACREYYDAAAVFDSTDGGEGIQPHDPDSLTTEVLAQTVDTSRKWESRLKETTNMKL